MGRARFAVAVLLFCGCSSPDNGSQSGDEDWYGIYMGESKLGYERRSVESLPAGQERWRRVRRYLFSIDGKRAESEGSSETLLDSAGRVLRYEHQAGGELRQAWMESEDLVTVRTASDGGSVRAVYPTEAPVGVELVDDFDSLAGRRLPILETMSMRPTWVRFEGDSAGLSWSLGGTRATRTSGGGSFGVISWRKESAGEAQALECCAELLGIYRMETRTLPGARSSRLAKVVLELPDGTAQPIRVERPLWLEIPSGGPIQLGPSDEPSVEILRTRIAPLLAGVSDQRSAVRRLVRWVQDELETKVTPGSLGHLQALQTGAGDCSEHAALFVAAARAVGIKSEVVWGWVYWDGAYGPGFYPHAWAQVEIEGYRKVPVDPILGQFPADATHITPGDGVGSSSGAWLLPGGRLRVESIAD